MTTNKESSNKKSPTKELAQKTSATPAPLGYDPGRMSDMLKPRHAGARGNSRIDLPAEAYLDSKSTITFPHRPGFNNNPRARKVDVQINQFAVKQLRMDKPIYQYDLSAKYLGTKEPKNIEILIKKGWNNPEFKKQIGLKGDKWLHDGKKLAWSTARMDNETFVIDLNYDRTNNPNNRTDNKIELRLRITTKINLSMITSYVEGKTDMDNSVIEALNFLDHLIRQFPSETNLAIRRQFYNTRKLHTTFLAPHVYAAKGTYASVRLNQTAAAGTGIGLGINVDVVNTAFWSDGCTVLDLVRRYCQWRWGYATLPLPEELTPFFRPDKHGNPSETMIELRRISRIRVTCEAQKELGISHEHTMIGFAIDKSHGAEGLTARNYIFDSHGESITFKEFAKKKYGITLKHPDWPMIQTSKPGVLLSPELCKVAPLQRYPYKLDPDMTARMIKVAVTKPEIRKQAIEAGRNALSWDTDPYFKHFGISVNQEFTKTQALILPPPRVEYYGSKKVDPPPKARWDLRGLKFKAHNTYALKRWGFLYDGGAAPPQIHKFATDFINIYKNHGGRIESATPKIQAMERDAAASIEKFNLTLCGGKKGDRADIIFVVLTRPDSARYEAVKKAGDCRVGIVTQCLLLKNVRRSDPQYHSNVAMKVNAKLGGITSTVEGINSTNYGPAIFMGVDVSHAPVGMAVPSMASMTLSVERYCSKYAAAVETNGFRKEMLTRENARSLLARLVPGLTLDAKKVRTIFYIRDGVSEGQFQQVLDEEVAVMREWFKEKLGASPKFTVIIATKRHHIRFFPVNNAGSDQNKNPLPGMVVERDVTHPHHHDFYLCSHSAIQGTSRPVHYHVIMDENKVPPAQLHTWIYDACFQYMRSTCAVSLHPAVYYAHLASNRARAHEKSNLVRTGETGTQLEQQVRGAGGHGQDTTNDKLMTLGGGMSNTRFSHSMWFI